MEGSEAVKVSIRNLSLWYGEKQALDDVSLDIPERSVTAIIGPSGCGKSTLLRCINRMNDTVRKTRIQGKVILDGKDVMSKGTDIIDLRRRVGIIFQKPTPFPFSVRDNVSYGCRMAGIRNREHLDKVVEDSLRRAALYEELKERLDDMAENLSGGQQQRMCIARTISMRPEVILMDEPCSALDPIATRKIEDLIHELKKDFTVVIVTHNMQQAARVSDSTAFMYLGKMLEFGTTKQVFEDPQRKETADYVKGKFG
jgi:phosphate transport system ATP-binding protein